ncbi:nucleoside hydrolase [Adhaeribacter aquaticus]|uniref:nucleoside hydrolase n=1 Tax=Adhaeribacter aquaticus TaxID=299567 RepID=UPI0004156D4E|nr:nucleoside hydrolase [Adhaeribacter aquaticus]
MKIVAALCFLLLGFQLLGHTQYKVILDADIDSDVDDVEALAMLHTLHAQKKIDFIGVIVTSDDPFAPVCVNAINNYFGQSRMPIGFLKNQPALKNHSKYTRQIAEEFPHKLASHEKAADATALYRKLLSQSPDSSVVIITIGHLTNFQNLLKSGSDKYSKLSGKDLAHRKVVKWICMGGTFPEGKEANFYRPDPGSTLYSLQHWQNPVTFAGWEVGNVIKTGGDYLKNKLSPQSPVYRAYQLYNNFQGRASWDQVAVFLLMDEATHFFSAVTHGYCQVNADGSNKWITDRDSRQEYVVLKPDANPAEIAKLMDDMTR